MDEGDEEEQRTERNKDENEETDLVGKVCEEILTNQRFQLPLRSSEMFHGNAAKLLQNGTELKQFSRSLELYLSKPLKSGLNLAKIWSAFHTISMGEELNKTWKNFCDKVALEANPLFYQYITEEVFKKLLLTKLDSVHAPQSDNTLGNDGAEIVKLTFEEENTLHYVGGYLIRQLLSKLIAKKTHVDALLLLQSDTPTGSQHAKWMELIDRGGLIHITEMFYQCLHSIEIVCRTVLTLGTESDKLTDIKQTITDKVVDDVDVRFYWDLAIGMTSLSVSDELLHEIVDLYTTIRGHSFVKGFMEKYKQQNKKGTQKTKALRKKLF